MQVSQRLFPRNRQLRSGEIAYSPHITQESSIKLLASILLAVAVASLPIAGCGGDGATGSAATGQPKTTPEPDTTLSAGVGSKAHYLTQTNQLCLREWHDIRREYRLYVRQLGKGMNEKTRFAEAAKNSLVASIDFRIFGILHFLYPPKGDKSKVESIVGPLKEAIERGRVAPRPISTPAKVWALFATFNQRAREFGLTGCVVSQRHARL